jgi:lysylphosphatidylglycerol synthetase-like protein (DUF2156 family)
MILRTLLTSYPLWSIVGATSASAAYLRARWVKRLEPVDIDAGQSAEETLLKWQDIYGYNAHGLVSISPDACAWADPEGRGSICYLSIGGTWLAAGDPFAAQEDLFEVAKGFIEAAARANKLVSFVPSTIRFAKLAKRLGLDAVPIGVAPYFDLQSWAPRGDRAKKVRAGINQARRAGVKIEWAGSGEVSEDEVTMLCRSWLDTRRSVEFGWLFALEPLRFKERKHFFIARDSKERMIGLLAASPIPARDGWYLEDILRHPEAPTGTSDLLIVEGMAELASRGATMATLGTAPAARLDMGEPYSQGNHLLLNTILAGFATHMEAIYNFQGLKRFKTKFAPSWWEPEYALFPPGLTHPARVGAALARAVAPTGIINALWNSSW